MCSLPLSFFSVRYRFLGRSHFARLALISLCRSHVSLFALIFWFPIILCRSHVYWFAIIFLGSLSFYWPALIFDASLSFFFAALIFLCRYHFLWFALAFLARSCFDSSVLAALKMQPPRSWISKTCLGSTLGGPILILVAAIILALSRSPRSISKREKAYFDIWILGRTWCVWFRIGSGVVTGSTAVC